MMTLRSFQLQLTHADDRTEDMEFIASDISAAVDAVANKSADIDATIATLLARPPAQEEA